MTGLDADTDHILEMACLITDSELNLIAEVRFAIFTINIFAYERQHEKNCFRNFHPIIQVKQRSDTNWHVHSQKKSRSLKF